MKKTLVAVTLLAMSSFAFAQRVDDVNGNHAQLHPTKDKAIGWARPGGGGAQNGCLRDARILRPVRDER